MMIRMITEYCNCADDLPMLATDILSKLIDLLKVNTPNRLTSSCVYSYLCESSIEYVVCTSVLLVILGTRNTYGHQPYIMLLCYSFSIVVLVNWCWVRVLFRRLASRPSQPDT